VKKVIDSCLIRELRNGSECAFETAFHLLHEKVYRFALAFSRDEELSREITQEAFIQLWINRGKLKDDLPLYPYLFTHVRRLTIDALRKSALAKKFRRETLATTDFSSNDTESEVLSGELSRLTIEVVRGLPPQQRLIFKKSRLDGQTYEEIAAELSISRNTVKYHLTSALKTLRQALAKQGLLSLVLLAIFVFF